MLPLGSHGGDTRLFLMANTEQTKLRVVENIKGSKFKCACLFSQGQ